MTHRHFPSHRPRNLTNTGPTETPEVTELDLLLTLYDAPSAPLLPLCVCVCVCVYVRSRVCMCMCFLCVFVRVKAKTRVDVVTASKIFFSNLKRLSLPIQRQIISVAIVLPILPFHHHLLTLDPGQLIQR